MMTSCQTSRKKIKEMRKQTQIENPYEIKHIEGQSEGPSEETDKGEQPPSAATKSIDTKSTDTKEAESKGATSKELEEKAASVPAKKVDANKINTPKADTKKVDDKPAQQAKQNEAVVPAKVTYPFVVGETVTYSMTYFALEAGKMTFEVKPFKQIQNERTFHFYASATTSAVFSMFYSVKDFAESFWSEKHQRPFLMKLYGEESKYVREVQASFDWKTNRARYQAKTLKIGKDMKHEDKSWTLNSDKAQDIISALYYLRTFDLEVGKTYTMHVAEKGKDIVVKAEVLRTESLRTRVGRFETLVVRPTFTVDGAWKQVGDIYIWLTNDERKIPIGFEAKVKIGTIKGKLHSLKKS